MSVRTTFRVAIQTGHWRKLSQSFANRIFADASSLGQMDDWSTQGVCVCVCVCVFLNPQLLEFQSAFDDSPLNASECSFSNPLALKVSQLRVAVARSICKSEDGRSVETTKRRMVTSIRKESETACRGGFLSTVQVRPSVQQSRLSMPWDLHAFPCGIAKPFAC